MINFWFLTQLYLLLWLGSETGVPVKDTVVFKYLFKCKLNIEITENMLVRVRQTTCSLIFLFQGIRTELLRTKMDWSRIECVAPGSVTSWALRAAAEQKWFNMKVLYSCQSLQALPSSPGLDSSNKPHLTQSEPFWGSDAGEAHGWPYPATKRWLLSQLSHSQEYL